MKLTRRQVTQLGLIGLGGISALSIASGEDKTEKQGLKILILGGTGFLGPHIVRDALSRGHTVTLFNRGKTDPHLFPDVEKLKGNRGGDLKALKGRKWDVVIDTSTFAPALVRKSSSLLEPNIGHYIYISSTAVYKALTKPNMDENSPVFSMDDPESENYGPFERYGASKTGCEMEVQKILPNRNTIIRSDTIVGPGDYKHHRYTYWIKRAAEGGEILGPGSADDDIQYIDVRDLAEWIVHCAVKTVQGTFTATSPAGSYTMKSMIDDCMKATEKSSPVVWVDSNFIMSNGAPDIPFWVPNRDKLVGVGRLDTTRAQQNGLKQRPKIDTARDVYGWYKELPKEKQDLGVGLTRDHEKQLIADWKNKVGT